MSAPPKFPTISRSAMMDMAAKAHRLLGCKGASRSDFRWDDEQGEAGIYLLEVNTQPGMTPLSLVPEQAKLKGISYGELVERLIAEALAMSAAHVRRGGAARAKPRKPAQGRGAEEDRQAAAGQPGPRQQLAGAGLRRLPARDRARRADRARYPGQGRERGRRCVGQAGFTVSGYQIVGIHHMDRLVDAVVTDELRRAADERDAKAPQALVDVAAIRERLLQFRLGQGRAGFAAAAGYAGHRHRRAQAGRAVAEPAAGSR